MRYRIFYPSERKERHGWLIKNHLCNPARPTILESHMAWPSFACFKAIITKFIISAFLCTGMAAYGQAPEGAAPQAPPVRKDSASYLASYWHYGIDLIKSPLHWNKEQWIIAGGTVAFTLTALSVDEPLNQTLLGWNDESADNFGKWGDVAGGPPLQFALSGSAILVGSIAKSPSITNFGLDNLQAQVFVSGLAMLVKNLSHRTRPETGDGPYKWYGPFDGWGNESFFSGHSALAFCTANMLFLHSHKKWWVGVLGYGGATAIGVSRMQQQKHWASDVVMGAVMGTAISSFVYKRQEKRREVRKSMKALP
jgi:membrane-associated phospholipid phosphatase